MIHGSLFSGIGGFDLAAQWAGWDNMFQVEKDDWCQRVLAKNFPKSKRYGDIKTFNGAEYKGIVDVVSGGFPCQPYSTAGTRKGKSDERHLWPEMLRVIREIQPKWVVGENVRGLVSWEKGLVFEDVCVDLENEGYEVQPFLLPAASVGAPHIRQRVWFIAYAACFDDRGNAGKIPGANGRQKWNNISKPCRSGQIHDANPNGKRFKKLNLSRFTGESGQHCGRNSAQWDGWTTEPAVCGMDDGIPNRVDRIAGLGNAVVPELVFRIFDTINAFNCG